MKMTAPYGTWPSPITAELAASATPTIDLLMLDESRHQGHQPDHQQGHQQGHQRDRNAEANNTGNTIYWLESRPDEAGRNAIVCQTGNDSPHDVLPAPYSARSRVHEYGGACYIVVNNILYFVAQDDQRVYRLNIAHSANVQVEANAKALPEPITPDNLGYRFADFSYDRHRNRLICVCEQHFNDHQEVHREPKNFIVAIPLNAPDNVPHNAHHQMIELVTGADFYAYPRISLDGSELCWISWNHPAMPWYGTELWRANLDEHGAINTRKHIAGSDTEAIFQPQWSDTGALYFVSDRSQWWNIYRHQSDGAITPICTMTAEFATPLWTLGMSTYAFVGNDKIVSCHTQNGRWHLIIIDINNGKSTPVVNHYTQISALTGDATHAWFVGASGDTSNQLIQLDIASGDCQAMAEPANSRSPASPELDKAMFAQAQQLTYETSGDEIAHAFFYAPLNTAYHAPDRDKPPLIVVCHGGPTGATSAALNLKIQFWTSRGFAVLDINYRGSTGYGRRYRELLDDNWGISDIDDVLMGAKHLLEQGLVDPQQLAIRGGSAGGYTVLAALTFHNLFKAGASYYGIGDLETLARDTHKFESRYLERLIGPYPDGVDIYQARSPINHIDQLTCPTIFFQGLDDNVVPPNQAEAMVSALTSQGLSSSYVPFKGEGHGFRKAENIAYALTRELDFYCEVFDFKLATEII